MELQETDSEDREDALTSNRPPCWVVRGRALQGRSARTQRVLKLQGSRKEAAGACNRTLGPPQGATIAAAAGKKRVGAGEVPVNAWKKRGAKGRAQMLQRCSKGGLRSLCCDLPHLLLCPLPPCCAICPPALMGNTQVPGKGARERAQRAQTLQQ
ncbi:hypothetical protein NDU88_003283 [Pleurodeles waltl]|uniref:Uncharacterized protein n=1 Tax=Pleurodeles waltl TaxID=8319 RepID=A0AAV7M3X4_PLEWA|nr:hypothetical protein NDU88_003283 [Pleurodeles waltl]